jgi:DNA-binding transcriptional LysR family regulator
MLDLTRLQVLVALARTGSQAAAADELHYSQPTISHHLRRLEAETGAVLVRKVGRGLQLTDEGRMLAARGEEILGLVARADAELAATVSLQSGHVRLAVFPSAVATLGPAIVTRAREAHPGLTLEVTEAEPPEAERLLLAGDVDMAVSFTYPAQRTADAITSEVLGRDPLYLVTPPTAKAPAAPDLPLSIGDLTAYSDEPWMAGCERCRGYLVSTCEGAGFTPRIQFASDDYVAVQALIAVGHGVSMLPGLALSAHRHPAVTVTPIESAARSIRLLTLGKPPLPAGIAAVSDVVRGVVAEVGQAAAAKVA